MKKKLVKNSVFLVIAGLMIFGNVLAYAADKETVGLTTDNPLDTFERFLEGESVTKILIKHRDRMSADERDALRAVGKKLKSLIASEQRKIKWRRRIEKVIRLIKGAEKADVNQTSASQKLSSEIINYITAVLFDEIEPIRMVFIEMLEDPSFPIRVTFPEEVIQILSSIAADKALSETELDYLEESEIPFRSEYFHYEQIGGTGRVRHKLGYSSDLRIAAIETLGAITKHQELPLETLLILMENMTNPLENEYVMDSSFSALRKIGHRHPLFFSSEMIRKFVENGFTFNINRIAEGVSVNVSATTQLLADIAKDKEIPNILLTRMADILSYYLDEAKFEKRWNLDLASTWRTPEEALENGRKELIQLKASTATFLRKIGKYQILSNDVIQAIEKLGSSETENPGIRQALQESLTSILKTKNPADACESSMRSSQDVT